MTKYSPYASDIDLVPWMHNNPHHNLPDQTSYNACQSFGAAFALEGKHERAGQPIAVNRMQTYRAAQLFGMGGVVTNNGASVSNVGQAWDVLGVPTNTTFNNIYVEPTPAEVANAAQYMGVELATIPYIASGPATDNTIETLRMLLDRGEFIIGTYRLTASFDSDAGSYSNWRNMDWDGSYATGGPSRGDHVVTFCGIDMAAGRVLFANHWGEEWGDGGFGGAPFDKFLQGPQGCFTNLQYIKRCRVQPVGVRTTPNALATPLTATQQQAFDNAMKAELQAAFGPGGNWGAALLRAVELRLTPAQFEVCAPALGGLPPGTVRSFIDQGYIQDPGFDWVRTYDEAIRHELALALGAGSDINAAVARANALKLSDKQLELYAPPSGLPRGILREFVDRGDTPWPAGMREEAGA